MSLSKRPSADRQILLKSSYLHGMERPVRSFKSFIRAIPSRASSDKPLPPIPAEPSPRKTSSSSSLTTVQTRSTRLSLWEPPLSWDNNEDCRDQLISPFAQRHYSPLIPEPPEDIAAMQADPVLWQQGHGPFQQTQLDPIRERNTVTPEVPPRNPSRPSTTMKNSRDAALSISSRYSSSAFDDTPAAENTLKAPVESANECLPSPLDLVSALKDISLSKNAFHASGLPSPRDQGIICDSPRRVAEFTHPGESSELISDNGTLKMFKKDGVQAADNPSTLDDMEVSDKMQALIFAQDYHSALEEAGFNEHDRLVQEEPLCTQPHDEDLTPRPLSWRKESGHSPPSETFQRPRVLPKLPSSRHKNLKTMSSWVNQRLKKEPQTHSNRRSVSDPGTTPQDRIPESEVDRHLKRDARLANIVEHGKEFVSRKILRRETEPVKPVLISRSVRGRSIDTPSAPFDIAKPVLRLPGGLAIVRQSSSTAPRPQTADPPPTSSFSNLSWPDFHVSSPFRRNFSRRGSAQSTLSQADAEFAPTIPPPQFSPLASPAHLQSFSYSTTSLPTSLPTSIPHDSPFPLSPATDIPRTRRRSHNIASPLSQSHSSPFHSQDPTTHESLNLALQKLNLFEKAKHAHDTWRKQQKETKNEKLKQSIRLIGPADARDVAGVAGYIKSAVDGRVSGDSGVGEGRLEYTSAP